MDDSLAEILILVAEKSLSKLNRYQLYFVISKVGSKFLTSSKQNSWRRMAAPDDSMCCHFTLARNCAKKKICPGVRARDKLVWDMIEDKQEKIFDKEGLAGTDQEKWELKTVLALVRREVESCQQHGFSHLKIITKSGGIIGGSFDMQDAGFFFIVEKKKNKKKMMSITVERQEDVADSLSARELGKENPMCWSLAKATVYQGAQSFRFKFHLRCASCQPGHKEARYGH